MFTYIYFGTADLARAARFYDSVMASLGHSRCDVSGEPNFGEVLGWGTYELQGLRELALWVGGPFNGQPATAGNGTMVALAAKSWAQVDEFHAAAVAHGGISDGAPGLRLHYNADFYAAYVRDPDGNKPCRRVPRLHRAAALMKKKRRWP